MKKVLIRLLRILEDEKNDILYCVKNEYIKCE